MTPGDDPSAETTVPSELGSAGTIFSAGTVVAGRYRIERLIGQGGMGQVYEAEDLTLGGRVALKAVQPEIASSDTAIERFKREIHLARKVSHDNVCRIYDLGTHVAESPTGSGKRQEVLFLTMELLAGVTLRDRIREQGSLPSAEALRIAEQIAAGLDAAHRHGVIHRDLKSANVVLIPPAGEDQELRAVITDFGLARAEQSAEGQSSISETGQLLGTPAYMAPEQVQGRGITTAVDIYAFGIVLYEMLTGVRPFDGGSLLSVATRRLTETPKPPRLLRSDLDPRWDSAILRCLERQAEARFATASEVVQAITAPGEVTTTGSTSGSMSSSATIKALLLTDLVGSTKLVEEVGDERASDIWAHHDRLARDLLAEHRGLEIDKTDGFLLLFERPSDAIHYCLAYHEGLRQLSEELGTTLAARAGIHLGEVFLRRNSPQDVARGAKPLEVEGLAKPMAARIMSLAGGGQTLLTQAAYNLARRAAVGDQHHRQDISWQSHGRYLVKGVAEPLEVFEVGVQPFAPMIPPPDSEKAWRVDRDDVARTAGRRRIIWLGTAAAAALALTAVLVMWILGRGPLVSLPQARLAVLAVQASGDQPDRDQVAATCTELLRFELGNAEELVLLPPDETAAAVDLVTVPATREENGVITTLDTEALASLRAGTSADVVVLAVLSVDQTAGDGTAVTVGLALQETKHGRVRLLDGSGTLARLPELVAGLARQLGAELGAEVGLPLPAQPLSTAALGPEAADRYRQGMERWRQLDSPAAHDLFTQALDLEPDNPFLLVALAETLWDLGAEDEALSRLQAAIARQAELGIGDRLDLHGHLLDMQRQPGRAAALYRARWLSETAGDDNRRERLDLGLRLASALSRSGRSDLTLALLDDLRELQAEGDVDPRILLAEETAVRRLSRYDQQLQVARQAVAAAGDQRYLLARSRMAEGLALRRLGRLDEAMGVFEEARSIFAAANHRKGEAEASLVIGNVLWTQQDMWGAKAAYDRAARLAAALGNRLLEARTLSNKALVMQDDADAAIEVTRRALQLYSESGDRVAEGITLLNLAGLLDTQERFDEAGQTYEAALEIITAGRNRELEAYGAERLAGLHLSQGELADARQRFEQAYGIYELAGDRTGIARILGKLSEVLLFQGDLERSEAQLRQALAIVEEGGSELAMAECRSRLGDLALARGDLAEAGALYRQALKVMEQEASEDASAVRLSLAGLYLEQGRSQEAISLARTTVDVYHHARSSSGEARALEVLARALLASGDHDRAVQQLGRAQELLANTGNSLRRLPVEITAARLAATEDRRAARGTLQSLLAEATAAGLVGYELEIRLALAEIELALGAGLEGKRRLQGVAAEARLAGFGLIAAKAERQRTRSVAPP